MIKALRSNTLNLEGTQHLANGVYVYQCDASQNFVGLTQKQNQVDLEVDMVFNVEEPAEAAMAKRTTHSGREKTDILTEIRAGTRQDVRAGTMEKSDVTTTTAGTQTTVVFADVTVTEVVETETAREWTEEWVETFTYGGGETPEIPEPPGEIDPQNEPDPEPNPPQEEIPEEEEQTPPSDPVVIPEYNPLEEVPETRDISGLWYVLLILSGGGLIGLLASWKWKRGAE